MQDRRSRERKKEVDLQDDTRTRRDETIQVGSGRVNIEDQGLAPEVAVCRLPGSSGMNERREFKWLAHTEAKVEEVN